MAARKGSDERGEADEKNKRPCDCAHSWESVLEGQWEKQKVKTRSWVVRSSPCQETKRYRAQSHNTLHEHKDPWT